MKNIVVTLSFAIGIACALFLFLVKQEVQNHEQALAKLNADIARDKEAIRILDAEWSHLNTPDRLQRLSAKYLRLAPLDTEQFRLVHTTGQVALRHVTATEVQ